MFLNGNIVDFGLKLLKAIKWYLEVMEESKQITLINSGSVGCITWISLLYLTILAVRKSSPLNIRIKTKVFDFETRVLIGWLVQSFCKPGNQNACLKVKYFCFYVKVACLSYGKYTKCILHSSQDPKYTEVSFSSRYYNNVVTLFCFYVSYYI